MVDRLSVEEEHTYETLWHLDSGEVTVLDGMADTEGLRALYSNAVQKATVVSGQTDPEWQGWIANSILQGDYRPINTLRCLSSGKQLRIVTVLDPFSQFGGVSASSCPDETDITILLSDGSKITLNERIFSYDL